MANDGDMSIDNQVRRGTRGLDMAIRKAGFYSEDPGQKADLDLPQRPCCTLPSPLHLGHPFRPVTVHPAWLTWHDGLLVSIARRMYNGRDFADMPMLADALEEAGCRTKTFSTIAASRRTRPSLLGSRSRAGKILMAVVACWFAWGGTSRP